MPPSDTAFASLGGAYTLTIEFPAACAATSELSRPRSYPVRFEVLRTSSYAAIYIAGGGYAQETLVGNLYGPLFAYLPASVEALLSWNNFDPICDGDPEPLPGGRTLMVCGDGAAAYDETTIVATIAGTVFISADGERERVCTGPHRLTFKRVTP